MKYIILAAGKGTRLRPKTTDKPKPLVNIVDNHSILRTHIHNADDSDYISEIIIIVGYENEMIQDSVNKMDVSTDISCVYNPYYNIVGPLGSVWSVNRELLQDDFILCNGDTVFHAQIYDMNDMTDPGVNILGSKTNTVYDDDLKIQRSSDDVFERVGKNIKGDGMISAGMISVVGEEARKYFTDSLYDLVSEQEDLKNNYWHSILNQIPHTLINIVIIHEHDWIEIDNPQDLSRASNLFATDWVNYGSN